MRPSLPSSLTPSATAPLTLPCCRPPQDTASGTVRTVIAERSNTYIDRGYDMLDKLSLIGDDIIW